MAKLTKRQSKNHARAAAILQSDNLSDDDCEFVFDHWHEGAMTDQTAAGAFFTPHQLASDFRIDVHGDRIIDLCAGIGVLSYYLYHFGYDRYGLPEREIVCIGRCPAFVEVGRKLLPQATWICADVFDFDFSQLGHFDSAIANPPFGRPGASTSGQTIQKQRYQGAETEYHMIDLASDLADYGTFIVPQMSAPFRYSGAQFFQQQPPAKYQTFERQTSIVLEGGCGIDTSYHADAWKQPVPITEIVTTDFIAARDARKPRSPLLPTTSNHAPMVQADLFA